MYKAFLNNKDDFPLKVKDDLSGSLDVSKELWKNGFVKIKKLLNQNQIEIIKSRFKEDLDTPEPLSTRWSKKYKNKYFLPSFGDENATFLSNIVGRCNNVDNVFEGILNEKRISKVLNVVLGKQYKLWQTTIRRSLKKDFGLSLHQDAPGEIGISILLNDHFSSYGTTSVIPKSHRFNIGCRESGAEQFLKPYVMKYFTVPLEGNAGDAFIFFKNTWHGRITSKRNINSESIFIGLFPIGYDFTPFVLPKNRFEKLSSELKNRLKVDKAERLNIVNSNRLIDYIYDKKYQKNSIWNFFYYLKPLLNLLVKIKKKIH